MPKKKRGAPHGEARQDTLARLRIPGSLRSELEKVLDHWQEWEGDDDRCIIRDDGPYSSAPPAAADRLLEAVNEVSGSTALAQRLAAIRPALVKLVKTTMLDDLDSVALLDWLVRTGRLEFFDDSRSVPAQERSSS